MIAGMFRYGNGVPDNEKIKRQQYQPTHESPLFGERRENKIGM
jgi:hypothetical protein